MFERQGLRGLSWRAWRRKARGCRWRTSEMIEARMRASIRPDKIKGLPKSEYRGINIDEFKKKWLEVFAAGIPQKEIEEHVLSTGKYRNFIWHIFSWQLIPQESYLMGEEARRAYMEVDKSDAIFIEPFSKTDSRPLLPILKNPHAVDFLCVEVYNAAKDFSWTYIKTHERDLCGPYFCRK